MSDNLPTYLDPSTLGSPVSPVEVTPLKTGNRADWRVIQFKESAGLPAPFADTDITTQLRSFFDKLDQEIDAHRGDPIALTNALARMEAVLADVRSVTANVRKAAAEALADHKVRRMTIDGLATVEGTSSSDRTDWQDKELMTEMLERYLGDSIIVSSDTGELTSPEEVAAAVLRWVRVEWRLTPIREYGLDPDDYSDQPKDEDGKPLRTPTIRMHENVLRKEQITRG